MKTTLRVIFITLLAFTAVPLARSQAISIPYSFGFEDSVELSNWVLNYGSRAAQCAEQWVVGRDARSEGTQGLYISNDGSSASYGVASNIVVAYREFSVPTRAAYDISFDWKSWGQQSTSDLYVLLLQPTDAVPESNPSSGVAGTAITNYSYAHLYNSSSWQNYSLGQTSSSTTVQGITLQANTNYKIAFVWANNCRDTLENGNIGACIDNLQIVSTNCRKPSNLVVNATCDTTTVTWSGSSTLYELEYKNTTASTWNKLGIQSSTSYEVYGLTEGSYMFRVRGICNTDTSAYVTENSVTIFCPEEHCINYVALDDVSVVTASTGTATNPFGVVGVVDYGSDDSRSRHTVNWIQDDFDPRTNNRLRKIPEGEVASVRLGNWETGAEGEGLSYRYTVSEDQCLLLLKYAVVLQDPSHNQSNQPGFLLEILDQRGNVIDPTCGRAEFYADASAEGWNTVMDGSNTITWKDWTTVGLDLTDYVGQTLYIRLSTWDCTQNAHYGYAYFTLDCTSTAIKTNNCGGTSTASIEAPDGFSYRWYNPNYPGQEWTTPSIDIPADDTTTYYCEVTSLVDASCSFTLYTQVFPQFPVAEFSYEYRAENCQNIVTFTNTSHIMTQYDGNIEHTSDPCESYYWDFGNGLSSNLVNPEVVFPNEGGTFLVTLNAYISEQQCMEDTVVAITIPAIGQTTDSIEVDLCQGSYYVFGSRYIMTEGIYLDTVPSVLTGCDSITRLDLRIHPTYDEPMVYDTICFGETYSFGGRTFTETTEREIWLTSEYGCDSIVSLSLYVHDEITFDVVTTDVLNGPNSGSIELQNVSATNYTWSLNGQMDASLTGLSGGYYTIIVYNETGCPSDSVVVFITQDCLEVELDEAPEICGDDSYFNIDYTIGLGYPTIYDVYFDDLAKAAGFTDQTGLQADGSSLQIPIPAQVRPGYYTMTIAFEDLLCEDISFPLEFTVKYPSSILAQKWNDVIAIYDTQYNGGYTFSDYQWYKDDEPIAGETGPYLYIRDGRLDTGSEYAVLLTREDDGVSVLTCPLIPVWRDVADLYPTVVSANYPVTLNLPEASAVHIYNVEGLRMQSLQYSAGEGQQMVVSGVPGYFFVHIVPQSGEPRSFKVLVTN